MKFLSSPWKSRSLLEQVCVCALIVLTIIGAPLVAAWFGVKAGAGLLIANTFATPSNVMRKVARRLVNNTVFASNGANRSYDDQYRLHGVKQGDTVTARLPQRYELTIGAVMNPTPLTDQTVQIKITDQSNVGFEYDSWAATLEVDDYMERYGAPAVDLLINNVDYTGLARMYKQVSNCKGTPGVVPGSTGTLPQAANQPYLDAVTELFDGAAPDPYNAFLSANMHAYLANANVAVFNPSAFISAMFRKGQFGNDALGIAKWFKTQNIATHTVGALGGTPLVSGAGQSGAAITINGQGAAIINGYFLEGDNISFAGVYSINPLTHASTGRLKQFTVTADTAAPATTAFSVPITPSLIASGPFANCTATPANGAVVKAFGSATAYAGVATPQGIIGHKDAFALVMADLVLPKGLWVSERISNAKLGISIRMLKDHDIINDISPARLDTAHGWKAIRQELACRVCS
jgi:hypothetical protein